MGEGEGAAWFNLGSWRNFKKFSARKIENIVGISMSRGFIRARGGRDGLVI